MLVLDTETTKLLEPEISALADQPHIVELAVIKVDDQLQEIARYCSLFNPNCKMSPEASKVSGITDADLVGAPEFAAEYPRIVDFFFGERILVAHNAPFDVKMLQNELIRIGKECQFPWPSEHWCTVEMTYHIHNRRMKMTELYEYTLKRPLHQLHRAMADTEALLEILRKLIL